MITAIEARRLLDYDPESGVLRWKVCLSNRAPAGTVVRRKNLAGYFRVGISRQEYRAHRIAYLIFHGRWPKQEIDHINGNRSDNRIANLRDVPHATNGRNTIRPKDNTSGVVGVCFHKSTRKWFARIGRNYLGVFDSFDDAVRVRKNAEKEYGFHPNHGRITPEET